MESWGWRVCITGWVIIYRVSCEEIRLPRQCAKTKNHEMFEYEISSHFCIPLKLNDLDRKCGYMYNVG